MVLTENLLEMSFTHAIKAVINLVNYVDPAINKYFFLNYGRRNI